MKNKQTSITFNQEDLINFQKKYPNILSKYLRQCVKLALKDYETFLKILMLGE